MSTDSVRRQKRHEVRNALAEHAMALFLERGFDNTTVDEIVENASISRRTFFRYFDTKEDVVLSWIAELAAELRETVLGRPPKEPPLTAARAALSQLVKARKHRYSPQLLRLLNETPSLRSRFLENHMVVWDAVADAIAEREGKKPRDLVPRVAARVSIALLEVALEAWFADAGADDVEDALGRAFAVADQLVGERTG